MGAVSNTQNQQNHYRNRARERDGKCLVMGITGSNWSRLRAAHIFPRAHVNEVSSANRTVTPLELFFSFSGLTKGTHISDDALLDAVGSYSKIDSIQNVFMLRSDLHDMFDNYEFGVNPDVRSFLHRSRLLSFLNFRTGQLSYHCVYKWIKQCPRFTAPSRSHTGPQNSSA